MCQTYSTTFCKLCLKEFVYAVLVFNYDQLLQDEIRQYFPAFALDLLNSSSVYNKKTPIQDLYSSFINK